MAERLRLLILGAGDFFSRRRYNTSFVILAEDQGPVLVDCPSPLRKIMAEAGQAAGVTLDAADVDHLILTHLHGDHCNGVEEFALFKRYVQQRRPALYTIPEVRGGLWEHRLKASLGWLTRDDGTPIKPMQLDDYYEVTEWQTGRLQRIGNLEFEIRRTRHYLPCFGFRVRWRGRWVFSYSGDTIFDPDHIAFLSEAPFIIHETNGEGHTRYEQLCSLPPVIRDRIHLIHTSDDFDATMAAMPVLEQGQLIVIP
ncbi:MAG: hypothetical protein Kow0059_01840 [Candidatus Sumerlaeia bacterium]